MTVPAYAAHRTLQFATIDEVLAEIDRIVAADKERKLVANGNWSPGEIMSHVAAWIEYGYQGYPMKRPPWIIRTLMRFMLKRVLRKGMPRGARIPGVKEGTYGIDDMKTQAAAERLRQAFLRLQSGEPAMYDSPAFGPMSHDDRIQLNLRHAELHLGYLAFKT